MEYAFQGRNGTPQFNWAQIYGFEDNMYHTNDWIFSDYQGPFGMLDLNNEYQSTDIPWRVYETSAYGSYATHQNLGNQDFYDISTPDNWGPLSSQPQFSEWDLNTGNQTMQPWDYYGPYWTPFNDHSTWDYDP